eukprot:scaffold122562_cov54-Cyclotella_meneghiniana.AAC.1
MDAAITLQPQSQSKYHCFYPPVRVEEEAGGGRGREGKERCAVAEEGPNPNTEHIIPSGDCRGEHDDAVELALGGDDGRAIMRRRRWFLQLDDFGEDLR